MIDNAATNTSRSLGHEVCYPDLLRKMEAEYLEELGKENKSRFSDRVGIALSGGGIRSATFALGIFQGLAKNRGLLRQIDFLSTVSGGGYFGGFFGRLLSRPQITSAANVEETLLGANQQTEALKFLRENGRYLSPNGGGDTLLFGAVILRNWVAIHFVLFFFVLTFLLGLQLVRPLLEATGLASVGSDQSLIWWSPFIWLPLLTLAFWVFPTGWSYWFIEPKRKLTSSAQGLSEVSRISPATVAWLVLVVAVVSALTNPVNSMVGNLFVVIGFVAAETLWLSWKASRPGITGPDSHLIIRHRISIQFTNACIVTLLLLALALVDSLGQSLYVVMRGELTVSGWVVAAVASLGMTATLSRWIAMIFSKGPQAGRPSIPTKLAANVVATVLVILSLVSLSAASHAIAWSAEKPEGAPAALLRKAPKEHSFELTVEVDRGTNADISARVGQGEQSNKSTADAAAPVRDHLLTFLAFSCGLVISVILGQTWPFLNQSSHLPLYGSRLTRAYLGASNRRRWGDRNVTEALADDDVSLDAYWELLKKAQPETEKEGDSKTGKEGVGAPIHLINVTINETIDAQSQLQLQDRKGLGLALGPCGWSAGVKHHMVWAKGAGKDDQAPASGKLIADVFPKDEYGVFDYPCEKEKENRNGVRRMVGQELGLGTWLSISGAAFSTGTGMRTSLAMSLLAGFGNIRLGYWWNSGLTRRGSTPSQEGQKHRARKVSLRIEDALARAFPVQVHLLDEFFARFPGTARPHWYLSDGGHFENLGVYELLRRRLRLIIAVDAGMDPDGTFEDLANLVRKARIDFGAEIRFLTSKQLQLVVRDPVARRSLGTLEQLREKSPPFCGAHAALAQVFYDESENSEWSWMLYIKPSLTGSEPVDILEYKTSHASFPHEPTIDQFFDEAQWESYRRLGLHIAEQIFTNVDRLVPDGEIGGGKMLIGDQYWNQRSIGETGQTTYSGDPPPGSSIEKEGPSGSKAPDGSKE